MLGRRTTSRGEEPGSGLGPGWWAAAALMAVVVIALVGVLVVVGTRDKTTVAAGDPTTATAAPSALPAPDGGGGSTSAPAAPTVPGGDNRPAGCATTGTDQTTPVDTPKDVTWTLVAGTAVPESYTDGPMLHTAAGVAYCYARTPVGAVLAVSNLGHATGDAQVVQNDELKYSVVAGPLADELAAKPAVVSDPAATSGVQYAGFRIISYTPDTASVALALASSSRPGSYAVVTATVAWSQGDWRVVLQPGPVAVATATSTTSLANFVTWSGVS
jgi:hypothetical protein